MSEEDTQPAPVSTVPEAIDSKGFEDSISQDMAQVYDKIEGKTEKRDHREAPLAPPTEAVETKDPLSATFEKSYDFLQMSKGQQDKVAAEHAEIDALKKFAAEHNIDLATAQQLKGAQAAPLPGQVPAEYTRVAEASKALGYTEPLHVIAENYTKIDQLLRTDPMEGVRHIAEQLGLSPLQVAQGLAARYGDQQLVQNNAERLVEEFFERTPGSADLQDLMLEAVESGKVRRTGHMASDLQSAFNYAQKQQKKEGKARQQGKHLDRSLREVYDRMSRK